MKKITSFLEKYLFGQISMSYREFDIYKNLVNSELNKLYSEKITLDNMVFVTKQDFDSSHRIKSIINYANTNTNLCSWIVNQYNCISTKDLFNVIRYHSQDLFSPGGIHFKSVIEILTRTEAFGVKNEEFAAAYLEVFLKQKLINSKVFRTETDCTDDLIHGIDLYFDYNGKKITCQVKPLKELKVTEDSFEILSSGRLKPYTVHYLIFVNFKENKVAIFKNKNVIYDDKTAFIKIENLVTKNF